MKKPNSLMMRAIFAHEVHKQMAKNNKIFVLVNDLGYKMWDKVKKDYPERFINAGAAEQSLIGIAVGLAISGKIPIVYSITTFLLYRPFETIRNYINHEKIPVKLIGSGRNKDYVNDGFSHWAEEDRKVMKIFGNIISKWPETLQEIPKMAREMIKSKYPWYINLRK
ncbi:MAG: hypothetical protein AAB662_00950 [Patescibacteria group bacterium]